jgi:hypothetical protein
MARYRKPIPVKIKEALLREAGNKCANPGCPNKITESHHIREYSVYQAHDPEKMIAVCPTCHACVKRGTLKIDDDTLYAWKKINRDPESEKVGHIYTEPCDLTTLLLGTISIRGRDGVNIFEITPNIRLSFILRDNDLCLLNIQIADLRNRNVVRIIDNYVKKVDQSSDLSYAQRPGKVVITTSKRSRFIPEWMNQEILKYDPDFLKEEQTKLLDLEVVSPGIVRVEGVWISNKSGVIITERGILFSQKSGKTIFLSGEGKDTVLNWTGPVNIKMFELMGGE